MDGDDVDADVEMRVIGVFMVANGESQQGAVFLTEPASGRVVPIFVGLQEAVCIDVARRGDTTPRPLCADLVKSVADACGASVVGAVVDSVDEKTYYGKLFLRRNDVDIALDARPSDCIAIALRAGAPVRMTSSVFKEQSITIDQAFERYKIVQMD